jgi:hypothetical protein
MLTKEGVIMIKVGDIVHIKSKDELRNLSEKFGIDIRIPCAGRAARILNIDKGHPYGRAYTICADSQHWYWFDAMFEEVTEW